MVLQLLLADILIILKGLNMLLPQASIVQQTALIFWWFALITLVTILGHYLIRKSLLPIICSILGWKYPNVVVARVGRPPSIDHCEVVKMLFGNFTENIEFVGAQFGSDAECLANAKSTFHELLKIMRSYSKHIPIIIHSDSIGWDSDHTTWTLLNELDHKRKVVFCTTEPGQFVAKVFHLEQLMSFFDGDSDILDGKEQKKFRSFDDGDYAEYQRVLRRALSSAR